jgi:hypothetical protein
MPDNASRRGAVDVGMTLMVVAFAVIGGFMYWLAGQAAIENEIVITEEVTIEDPNSGVPAVDLAALEADATVHMDAAVRIAAAEVASVLGTQGLWIGTPSGNPFLVSMSADVMAEGLALGMGDTISVVGMVNAMNDSTLTAWTGAETIGPNDRIVAEFATYFIEATSVRVLGGAEREGSGN